MKKLVLVRHAKAVSPAPEIDDFERSLTGGGRNVAREMASRLRISGFQPDLLISSPANRALETAHVFAEVFAYPIKKVLLRESIYESSGMDSFLYLIGEIESSVGNVILFGHNPTISDFADTLLNGFSKSMPKTAMVEIAFERDNWHDIQPGEGRLANFDYPGNNNTDDINGKITLKEIRKSIRDDIRSRLAAIDSAAADSLEEKIDKTARKIVRQFAEKAEINEPD